MHKDELQVDEQLVRQLVDSQFPDYQNLDLTPLGETGSTNKLFRLGHELVVRMPRQPGAGSAVQKEAKWLPFLREHLTVQIPEVVHIGAPMLDYSEHWSICRWIDGDVLSPDVDFVNRSQLAEQLAEFIAEMRRVAITPEASSAANLRWYRGRALVEWDETTRFCIEKCRENDELDIDLDLVAKEWQQALQLSGAHSAQADQWFHSDLVSENLLLREGQLAAVLDFGSVSVGDPTIDLHSAWELFDANEREVFRSKLGVDEATWLRGRAWALAIAVGALAYYWHSLPRRRTDRLRMLHAVLQDQVN